MMPFKAMILRQGRAPTLLDMPLVSSISELNGKTVVNVGGCFIDPSDGPSELGCLACPPGAYLRVDGNLLFGSFDFEIEFYAKVVTPSGFYSGLCAFEAAENQDFSFAVETINPSALFISTTGSSWVPAADYRVGEIQDGNWHRHTFRRVGTSLRFLLDGIERGSFSVPSSFPQRGPFTYIGAKQDELSAPVSSKFQKLTVRRI